MSLALFTLRKPAKEKRGKCQIDTSESDTSWLTDTGTQPLNELFQEAWQDPKSFAQDVIEVCVYKLVQATDQETRADVIKTLMDNESVSICNAFLDYFLTALHRKSRKDATLTQ